MSAQDNLEIAHVFFDAFNNRDFARASQYVANDAEFVNVASGEVFRGPDGFRRFQENWARAFPDGAVEITRVVADDMSAVVEYVGRGTHDGPLTSPGGDIPATHRAGELRLCDVYELRHGKLVAGRTYFDTMTLLRQLGVIPSEAASRG